MLSLPFTANESKTCRLCFSNSANSSSPFSGASIPEQAAPKKAFYKNYLPSSEPKGHNDTDAHGDHIAHTVHDHRVKHAFRLFVTRAVG